MGSAPFVRWPCRSCGHTNFGAYTDTCLACGRPVLAAPTLSGALERYEQANDQKAVLAAAAGLAAAVRAALAGAAEGIDRANAAMVVSAPEGVTDAEEWMYQLDAEARKHDKPCACGHQHKPGGRCPVRACDCLMHSRAERREPERVVLIARCPKHGLHGCRDTCFECGGPVEQVPMVAAEGTTTEGDRP